MERFKALPGRGAQGFVNGREVKVVSPGYLSENGIELIDPEPGEMAESVARMAEIARVHGLLLHACAQPFLAGPEVARSSCIDGRLLQALHPRREPASAAKDGSQRRDCGCTESVDIGSYTQTCPHGCVYCYANPRS